MGLYLLQRPCEYRHDWLYIADLTLELGAHKCLVVLGISQARWKQIVEQSAGKLCYQDLSLLALKVMKSTKGDLIYPILEAVGDQVGVPLQLVSDQGSDLYKGIRLYHQAHPSVQVTYDVTHQSARLLKGELELDPIYQRFVSRCTRTRQQLQQSRLSFLRPPAQRSKARYFNIDTLLKWAKLVLAYQKQQDFSRVNPGYCLDSSALKTLSEQLTTEVNAALKPLKQKPFPDQKAFIEALKGCLSEAVFCDVGSLICQTADLGRRYFEEKLGWVSDYQEALEPFNQMLFLVRTLQYQLKHQGFNQHSKTDFIKQTADLTLSKRLEDFLAKLIAYIDHETTALPPNQPLLASSDLIESVFGKYKLFSQRSSLKHMGHLLLTLPLLTTQLTSELVKTAMETVSFCDVQHWYRQHFGESPLAKRRAIFQTTKIDI
ncbi:hypothetical protein LYNGBM3L_39820 [Moorena producens 3L]|nr:hypothetical protein LYNGBM3L_39820 [Moorena producens 3L]